MSKLGSAERDLIRSGDGRVDVGDPGPVDPGQGAVLRIQRDVRQRMNKTGPEDLSLLATCAPRLALECYTSLESTRCIIPAWCPLGALW
ncbi:MAG: hypothetical protein ACPG3X_04445 [Opitutales bacterium]